MKEIELLKIIFKNSSDILEPLNEIDKEIERLNNIINKAIDYIMTNHCLHLLDKSIINSKELIDILKGSDKE